MTVTIQKWGNSQGIRLPKVLLDEIQWSENEEVEIMIENGRIIIKKPTERKNIMELFENYNEEYEPVIMNWGEPVGEEIW